MATTLKVNESIQGGGSLEDTTLLATQVAQFGNGVLPDLALGLTDGTGNFQANKWYLSRRTVANGANDDLDLAGGLTNPFGTAITFSFVKRLLVAVVSPDGTKKVRVGPAGVANAWQGPWGGVTAAVYEEVFWKADHVHPYAGWAVTGGTGDILRVTNPGASSLDYAIWILGY